MEELIVEDFVIDFNGDFWKFSGCEEPKIQRNFIYFWGKFHIMDDLIACIEETSNLKFVLLSNAKLCDVLLC